MLFIYLTSHLTKVVSSLIHSSLSITVSVSRDTRHPFQWPSALPLFILLTVYLPLTGLTVAILTSSSICPCWVMSHSSSSKSTSVANSPSFSGPAPAAAVELLVAMANISVILAHFAVSTCRLFRIEPSASVPPKQDVQVAVPLLTKIFHKT